MRKRYSFGLLILCVLLAYGLVVQQTIPYKVVQTYTQPEKIFVEGLVLDDGILYQSSGLYLQSKIIKIKLASGDVLQTYKLPQQYFAEGITIIGNNLYQLTYHENTLFIYDKTSLTLKGSYYFPYEGWGLTTDGKQLIFSNGTAVLQFMDPVSLKITRRLIVKDKSIPINNLNSLQFVANKIYANVYMTDKIAVISATNGEVEGWIDLKKINKYSTSTDYRIVPNGIAYNEQKQTLLVTGKFWPSIYELQLQPSS